MVQRVATLGVAFIALVLVAAACATTAPTISIAAPTDGATVSGPDVPMRVAVNYLTLDPGAIGKANEAGKGHWHLLVDGKLVSPVGTTDTVVKGLTPGQHTLKAELHNNDHSAVSPAVEKLITITVR